VRHLQAYADGVNAWLDDHTGAAASLEYAVLGLQTDYTPEPWVPADSLAWLKAMAWDLRTNIEDETDRALLLARLPAGRVAELYPPYPYHEHRPIVASGQVRGGQFVASASVTSAVAATSAASVTSAVAATSAASVTSAVAATPTVTAALQVLAGQARALPELLGLGRGGPDLGSNAWAVAGSRTTTGGPLLANDPHLAPVMPSVWYQMGLHCTTRSAACPYDVAGYTFAGLPGVIIGHNDRIAWGFTNLGPDVTDLYLEKVDGDTYAYGGRHLPLGVRTERIAVAGGDPVTVTIRSTRHGPLISDVDAEARSIGRLAPAPTGSPARGSGYAVALAWTALTPGRTADAIFAMDAARSWPEFRAGARSFDVPSQNLVYADRDGHIGYQAPGTIPIRGAGTGDVPALGWDPAYDWVGTIPYDALPRVLDPPEGYVVTANQAAAASSYPYHLTDDWDYGYRSQRIVDLLEQAGPLDVAAMSRLQMDTRNPMAPALVPALMRVSVDEATGRARDLLRGWDFTQPADSAAAAYYNAVWRALLRLTFHDEMPESTWPNGASRWFAVVGALLADPGNAWWDDTRTRDVRESRDDIIARALREARTELDARLGTTRRRGAGGTCTDWTW